ncbi:MAG: hypothetical protein ABW171_18735 [Steroidobacter sp.]
MSEADTYARDLAHLRELEATLRKELRQHQADEARALEEALRLILSANKADPPESRDSRASAAQQARQKANDAGRNATGVAQKIAQNEKLQENILSRLRSAERAGQLAIGPEDEARRQQAARVRRLEQLANLPDVPFVPVRQPLLEKLRVLYLSTDPYLDLATELEVRQVQQALQGVKYRDRVDVQLRSAPTFPELIAGLNSVRPHIVHCSGYTGDTVRVDEDDVMHGGDIVDFVSLMRALAVTDRPPELLVLNECASLAAVAVVLPAVPVIIGMSDAILDTAAIVFSQQLYAAIASGQSVGAALRRGTATVKAVVLDDDAGELPMFVAREDVDLESLVLVQAQ